MADNVEAAAGDPDRALRRNMYAAMWANSQLKDDVLTRALSKPIPDPMIPMFMPYAERAAERLVKSNQFDRILEVLLWQRYNYADAPDARVFALFYDHPEHLRENFMAERQDRLVGTVNVQLWTYIPFVTEAILYDLLPDCSTLKWASWLFKVGGVIPGVGLKCALVIFGVVTAFGGSQPLVSVIAAVFLLFTTAKAWQSATPPGAGWNFADRRVHIINTLRDMDHQYFPGNLSLRPSVQGIKGLLFEPQSNLLRQECNPDIDSSPWERRTRLGLMFLVGLYQGCDGLLEWISGWLPAPP
ncbi:hypothetical protein IE81DRAFT_350555 [Ceraceosorus guamensis]|uniref:Uncharacterized protein n=1 Tax=Ceraceosorus guamensis TaxID=1522189 RepID=A0A316VS41_9BASI|nr:hypothetical protein IE81DRAFT_350555 [Ceraceosorus guamensis]PWN39001.1 hypothetical protein IE81DRAFT_350555 [Ceraceosorus guamensis]